MVFLVGGYRALNSKSFGLPVGETALAGSVVLAIMALPTIITISEDAMQHTACHEASLALGHPLANDLQGGNSIFCIWDNSGCHIRIGRAIGETIAVLLVTNAAVIPIPFSTC
jgi:phosphate transport system permease protein